MEVRLADPETFLEASPYEAPMTGSTFRGGNATSGHYDNETKRSCLLTVLAASVRLPVLTAAVGVNTTFRIALAEYVGKLLGL